MIGCLEFQNLLLRVRFKNGLKMDIGLRYATIKIYI